jgi:hypothetical protein
LVLTIPLATIVHLITIHSFKTLREACGHHLVCLQEYFGRRSAAVIVLSAKLPFAVCASAALAVTSGFVFNEVFIYWFPNFAFAFLLLGVTAALNLISQTAARFMQVLAVAVVCIGLSIVSVAAFSHLPGQIVAHELQFDFHYRHLAAGLVVLIGYDLGLNTRQNDPLSIRSPAAMVMAVIGGALLLSLWGVAAMSVVSPERLESSTVPYMTAARKALGQPGRYIMGGVAIAAVFSALNAMMHSVSQLTGQSANLLKKRPRLDHPTLFRPAAVLLITSASAILMAAGFAGEPHLETWIRAGITLWLSYYLLVNIAAIRAVRNKPVSPLKDALGAGINLKWFSVVVLALAGIGLILMEPEPMRLLTFTVGVIAVLVVLVHLVDFFLYAAVSTKQVD